METGEHYYQHFDPVSKKGGKWVSSGSRQRTHQVRVDQSGQVDVSLDTIGGASKESDRYAVEKEPGTVTIRLGGRTARSASRGQLHKPQ